MVSAFWALSGDIAVDYFVQLLNTWKDCINEELDLFEFEKLVNLKMVITGIFSEARFYARANREATKSFRKTVRVLVTHGCRKEFVLLQRSYISLLTRL